MADGRDSVSYRSRRVDIIFCMEKSHLNRLRRKFPEALRDKLVICLHSPDKFELWILS